MFDVTDKRAVDRLAAVVVMLEQREAEARQAYTRLDHQVRGEELGVVPPMSEDQRRAACLDLQCASARWTEAQYALASARELATDR